MVISSSKNTEYLTELTNGKETTYSDSTSGKKGSTNHFQPHDLLEASYAACLNITTRIVLGTRCVEPCRRSTGRTRENVSSV